MSWIEAVLYAVAVLVLLYVLYQAVTAYPKMLQQLAKMLEPVVVYVDTATPNTTITVTRLS